jgi:hypothetical protein
MLEQTTLKRHKEKHTVVWEPQPGPQSWLITCPVFETLFGGARGGGKSDGVLGEWATHADMFGPNAIGLCVRRERTQLVELIERSRTIYKPLGANFHEQDKLWRFPNGARLRFAYLESDNDAQSYQGHSYTRVYVEEMGTFANPAPIFKLMATLRSGASVPCRFIATANPGGPGHLWIKQRYIDPSPLGLKIIPTEFENPFTGEKIQKDRVFIPSKVIDNKYTNTADYIGNLYLAGDDQLVQAWLLGDWNVLQGAYFHEWDARKHVIKQFKVPDNWTRFMSVDWGSYRPFSVGWYCVVPDDVDFGYTTEAHSWFNHERVRLPRGAIIKYRELYGVQKDRNNQVIPNVGLKLTVEDLARLICQKEQLEPKNARGRPNMAYRVGDPKMDSEDGGPSMFERLGGYPYYLQFQKADNKRMGKNGAMGGWDMLRQRLKGDGDRPMIYFMDNCVDTIRTLPALQRDEDKPEDVDTEGEDHAADETRYACMSRPYSRPAMNDVVRSLLRKKENDIGGIILRDDLDEIMEPSKFNEARIN